MKNRKIAFMLVAALFSVSVSFFTSCKDESGKFVEQYYTNQEKDRAVRACLKQSSDSALSRLFKYDGFYGADGYRIDFTPIQSTVFDTLSKYGKGYMCDSLVLLTNRMAESCAAQISPYMKKAIDTLDIVDPGKLLNGADNAITRYFMMCESSYLKSAFQSPVSIRLNVMGVNALWSRMYGEYIKYSSAPLNFDFRNYVVEKMLDNVLVEMEMEERLIRTDSTHLNDNLVIFKR